MEKADGILDESDAFQRCRHIINDLKSRGRILLNQKTNQPKRDLGHEFFWTIADTRDLSNVSVLAGLVKLGANDFRARRKETCSLLALNMTMSLTFS
jgi:hypothetical protein